MNKFASILQTARDPEPESKAAEAPTPANSGGNGNGSGSGNGTTTARKIGRPAGKRTDPDYMQTSCYIRQQTHRQVKIALLQDGGGQEFSELVESLLADWLAARI